MDVQAEPNVYQTIKRAKRTCLRRAQYRGCFWLTALCFGLMCILQATLNIVLRHYQFKSHWSNLDRYKQAVEQLLTKYHTVVEERDELLTRYKDLQKQDQWKKHLIMDKHSLQYHYTILTPGTQFPEFSVVGLVDGEQFVYYDSNIRKMIPKTEWMKRIEEIIPYYWENQTQAMWRDEENLKLLLDTSMKYFKHTEGLHTLQRIYTCELYTKIVTRYDECSYNGEDFISLDVRSGNWTAANNDAEIIKDLWKSAEAEAKYRKNYLENECIKWLKLFVSYSRETPDKNVCPRVSLSLYPAVMCHATGFFPKAVRISWWKDGKDINKYMLNDVDEDKFAVFRETLPNQDGTFQKRSILKVPVVELLNHNYSCVIQHSSLEEDIVLPVKGFWNATFYEAPSECSCVAPIPPVAISVLVAFVCSFAGFVI